MPSMDRGSYSITPENHGFREAYNKANGWDRATPKQIHHKDTFELEMLDKAPSGHVMQSFAGAVARHKTHKLGAQGYPKSHYSGTMDTPDGVVLATETVHGPRKGKFPLEANTHSYHVSSKADMPSSYRHERAIINSEDEQEKPQYKVMATKHFDSHEALTKHMQGIFTGSSAVKKSLARLVEQLDDREVLEKAAGPDRRVIGMDRRENDRRAPSVHEINKEPHIPVKIVSAFAGMASRHAAMEHPTLGKPVRTSTRVFNATTGTTPGAPTPHTVLMASTAHYAGGHSVNHSYILGPGERSSYSADHQEPLEFAPNHLKSEEFRHPDEVAAHMNSLHR